MVQRWPDCRGALEAAGRAGQPGQGVPTWCGRDIEMRIAPALCRAGRPGRPAWHGFSCQARPNGEPQPWVGMASLRMDEAAFRKDIDQIVANAKQKMAAAKAPQATK